MKPWTTWLARLGIAGACCLVFGCGGSDVPDASSDGQAATGTPDGGGGAPRVAAAPEEPKVAQADQTSKTEEAAAEATPPSQAPEADAPAAAPKSQQGQGNSNAAEMLAMATGPAGGSNPPAAGSTPPAAGSNPPANSPGGPGGAGGPGASGGPGAPGGMRPGGPGALPGGGMGPGMGPGTGPGMNPGMGRAGGGNQPQMGPGAPGQGGARMEDMAKSMAMNQRMGGAGGPGGPTGPGTGAGGSGAAQQDTGPADFHSPEGAVRAFLSALKAKDVDRLNESTALRAHVEASSSKNRDLFQKIFDLSLSDTELDELSKKLDGYTIAGENPARSTAKVEVILQKPSNNGGYFKRKVTVRHEKKGWGVLDVAGEQEFKALNSTRNRKR